MTPSELRMQRTALHLTQGALASALGVARNTVARWERGELPMGNPALIRLALERLGASTTATSPVPMDESRKTDRRQMLPAELSSFVGREHQLVELREVLSTARLLTLTGVAGVGKTRLAI